MADDSREEYIQNEDRVLMKQSLNCRSDLGISMNQQESANSVYDATPPNARIRNHSVGGEPSVND